LPTTRALVLTTSCRRYDALEVREDVDTLSFVGQHTSQDLADGAPRNAQELSERASVGLDGEPRDEVFEGSREARASPRPGNAGDDDPVLTANDAR
jgi:hypothetical protein